jgi:type I restriction enzyme S subunit
MKSPARAVKCLLGDLAPGDLMQVGPFGSQLHASDYTPEGVAVIMPSDLRDGRLDASHAARTSTEMMIQLEKHGLKEGDLVFARRGDIGRVALVCAADLPALCGTGCIRVRLDGDLCSAVVLEACRSPAAQRWLRANAVGQTMLNLNGDILSRLPLVLPPVASHPAIERFALQSNAHGEIVKDLIAAQERQLEGFKQILLNGSVRFPGYHATWPSVRLSDVADVDPPTRLQCSDDTPVSFVPMADITEGGDRVGSSERSASAVASGYSTFLEGDILVAKITPCFENGKAWLATGLRNGAGLGSTEFYVIRCGRRCLAEYLWLHVTSARFRRKGAANMIGSAGQKRVAKAFVQNFEFALPELNEQQRICALFSEMSCGLRKMTAQRDCLIQLQRTVFRHLFPGHDNATRLNKTNSKGVS